MLTILARSERMNFCHCNIRDSRFRWRMVSLTALNTTLIFSVSTAVVKWWKRGLRGSRFTQRKNSTRNSCTSSSFLSFPENVGKNHLIFVSPDFSFSASRSVLFRNKIIDTPLNTRLFTMVSNMFFDSSNRFVRLKPCNNSMRNITHWVTLVINQ